MSGLFQVLDWVAELVRSGMTSLIRAVLSKHIGDEEVTLERHLCWYQRMGLTGVSSECCRLMDGSDLGHDERTV